MKFVPVWSYKWFKTDFFFATLFLFISVFLLGLITFNLSFLNPISKALADFNFSDLLYSKLNTNQETIDTNIVLVNIGHLNRSQITEQLRIIKEHHPKIIGFDGFFAQRRDSAIDGHLRYQFLEGNKVVMACFLTGENEISGEFDSLETSNPFFNSRLKGFVNLGGANPTASTVRKFSPIEVYKGDTLYAMAVQLARVYNPDAFRKLVNRKNDREIIRYIGNRDAFIGFDVVDIFDSLTDLNILKNKIVLMGYIGESFQHPPDLEDIYYTPMNPEISGRSRPDMYGVVIHANIASMILSENYINTMPVWLTILISFMVCYFYIFFITWFKARKPWLFEVVFPVFLLFFNVLIIYLFFLLYQYYHYEIHSGYFLAPILLFPTFKTYYERSLMIIGRHIKINSIFLPK